MKIKAYVLVSPNSNRPIDLGGSMIISASKDMILKSFPMYEKFIKQCTIEYKLREKSK